MKVIWLGLLAAFVGFSSSASAQGTGKDMLGPCKTYALPDPPSQMDVLTALRIGYCRGVVEAVMEIGNAQAVSHVCVPKEVGSRHAVQVVVKYLDAHPDELSKPFGVLAAAALHDAWPCTK